MERSDIAGATAGTQSEAFWYAEWKRDGHHLLEYGSEFIGTAFLVFCVVVFVALMFAPGAPGGRYIPSHGLRLLLTGLSLGSMGWLVALSPPGRLSGAHINPAVSAGFWILGKMHGRDAICYGVAQMLGGWLGAVAGHALLPGLTSGVNDAFLAPVPGIAPGPTFLAETAATFVMCGVIYYFVSHDKLMRWTPAACMVAVGVLVWLDGSISGAGMNPARWFGPAALLHNWRLGWAYTLGPLAGGIAAAVVSRQTIFCDRKPHTGKLFHDARYRSIFRHDAAASRMPESAKRWG